MSVEKHLTIVSRQKTKIVPTINNRKFHTTNSVTLINGSSELIGIHRQLLWSQKFFFLLSSQTKIKSRSGGKTSRTRVSVRRKPTNEDWASVFIARVARAASLSLSMTSYIHLALFHGTDQLCFSCGRKKFRYEREDGE